MLQALTDPDYGYYTTGTPFGRAGDFITAPEISQMFGELIGLWCADSWQRLGAPESLLLVDLGPGRGTLMADALRAARLVPGFLAAQRLHLVEASAKLRAQQAEALGAFGPTWHDSLGDLPEGPIILIANEFFDALPVRQFERSDGGWCERRIGLDEADQLNFVLTPPSPANQMLLPEAMATAAPGTRIETSPFAIGLADEIGRRVAGAPGAALVIDYARDQSHNPGLTLQAVRDHASHPVLAEPGTADLSAAVDLTRLAEVARQAGAATAGPLPQGAFLERLGIGARAAALARNATADQAQDIEAAKKRLCDPEAMGELFQVLSIHDTRMEMPAGFH